MHPVPWYRVKGYCKKFFPLTLKPALGCSFEDARITVSERPLRIGDLAARIGVHPEAIRYYERRGLLPRPARLPNRYRMYTPEHLQRVEFIKRAQGLGLSLAEIREVLELKYTGESPCQHVRDLLRAKLNRVDRQLADLRAFRRELADSFEACERSLRRHSGPREFCPVLERIRVGGRERKR